mmetsp:Transcript_13981/g.28768  ORF Transcript_13981/g.28768 Transcript_13981/m.28768 type:complete len:270 (-) Transcript_13981:307-1116(-)
MWKRRGQGRRRRGRANGPLSSTWWDYVSASIVLPRVVVVVVGVVVVVVVVVGVVVLLLLLLRGEFREWQDDFDSFDLLVGIEKRTASSASSALLLEGGLGVRWTVSCHRLGLEHGHGRPRPRPRSRHRHCHPKTPSRRRRRHSRTDDRRRRRRRRDDGGSTTDSPAGEGSSSEPVARTVGRGKRPAREIRPATSPSPSPDRLRRRRERGGTRSSVGFDGRRCLLRENWRWWRKWRKCTRRLRRGGPRGVPCRACRRRRRRWRRRDRLRW